MSLDLIAGCMREIRSGIKIKIKIEIRSQTHPSGLRARFAAGAMPGGLV
jgi:hypothetical protein